MAKIIFEEKKHIYWRVEDDGTRIKIPSVTKVIGILDKPALLSWAARITAEYLINLIPDIKSGDLVLSPEDAQQLFYKAKAEASRIRDEAADIGTKTHEAIENYLKTKKKPKGLAPEVQKTFNGFLLFAKEMKLGEVIASEKILYSTYGYCGKLDIVAYLGKKKYIVDVKTSKGFYREMPLQLSAYHNAFCEMTGEKTDDIGIGIIRLDKSSGLAFWKDYSDKKEISFKKFLCLLDFNQLEKESANK